VVEQRREFTRANILKLWPFLVHDLRTLGAKIFFPHFCTGGLMHIGTQRLQSILLKDALLLGVTVEYGLCFSQLAMPATGPTAGRGWRLLSAPRLRHGKPTDTPALHEDAMAAAARVEAQNVDALFVGIGQQAPVVSTTVQGKEQLSFSPIILEIEESATPLFELKKVQYSQALGLVTHFENTHSAEENAIKEQSGIAKQFNIEMFESLQRSTMADLENVVYYKGG
jgi:hypothetical protein